MIGDFTEPTMLSADCSGSSSALYASMRTETKDGHSKCVIVRFDWDATAEELVIAGSINAAGATSDASRPLAVVRCLAGSFQRHSLNTFQTQPFQFHTLFSHLLRVGTSIHDFATGPSRRHGAWGFVSLDPHPPRLRQYHARVDRPNARYWPRRFRNATSAHSQLSGALVSSMAAIRPADSEHTG
jgi:hypothetical protein